MLILLALVVIFCVSTAVADCDSDAREAYERTVTDCRSAWDGPDDAQRCQACIDEAKAEYESAKKGCENMEKPFQSDDEP